MVLKRMDNVGIVVDDLGATVDFFRELGLELEGRATIEGEWAGRVTGLGDQRGAIADETRCHGASPDRPWPLWSRESGKCRFIQASETALLLPGESTNACVDDRHISQNCCRRTHSIGRSPGLQSSCRSSWISGNINS